jgi:hypothetical protein
MKPGTALPVIIASIDRTAALARDLLAPARALRLRHSAAGASPGFLVELEADGQPRRLLPTELVHDQLVALTGVPQGYYRRLRQEAPALLEANVNEWLQRSGSRQLLRTLADPLQPVLRALVSDRFRALDHRQLLEAVLPTLHQRGVAIVSSELSAVRLHLKAVNERLQGEVRVGETVMAGIVISNSEVGAGALTIQPLLYTLRCRNGLILEDATLRRHHLGRRHQPGEAIAPYLSDETRAADDRAFFLTVRDLTRAALDEALFHQQLGLAAAASRRPLPAAGPEAVVELAARRHHLSEGEGGAILAHLRAGGDLSHWGLVSAVTRAAQEVDDYERSTELERLGGRLLGSPELLAAVPEPIG